VEEVDDSTANRNEWLNSDRLLIIIGGVLLVLGIAFAVLGKLGVGRLPGDFVIRRGSFTLVFSLMTSLLVSLALTLLFWFFRR